MSRLLVLAGGSPHAHDFAASGAALADLLGGDGHDVDVVDHPDAAAGRLAGGAYDALVVCGLWWRMEGAVYDRWRPDWRYETPASTRDAVDGFVRDGGGLVAVHTAPICFDDWSGWGSILGGAWRWGVSSHPPYGPVEATVVAPEHPVVRGLPATLRLHDEVYGGLDVSADVDVLAIARRTPDDTDQPVVWAHRHGAGRVVFDGFGHDAASIAHPGNGTLLRRAVAWVTGPVAARTH